MAFKKFNADPDGTPVFWHRRSIDNAPWRGKEVLALRQDEIDEHAIRVWSTYTGMFDPSDLNQVHFGMTYRMIMDAHLNGHGRVLFRQKFHSRSADGMPKIWWYVEWAMPFMELDDSPEMSRRKGDAAIIQIAPNGQPQQG